MLIYSPRCLGYARGLLKRDRRVSGGETFDESDQTESVFFGEEFELVDPGDDLGPSRSLLTPCFDEPAEARWEVDRVRHATDLRGTPDFPTHVSSSG